MANTIDIGCGLGSATGPDSRSDHEEMLPHSEEERQRKRPRSVPSGRWGLPSTSLSLVGHDETALIPLRFAISTGKTHRRYFGYLNYGPLASSVHTVSSGEVR